MRKIILTAVGAALIAVSMVQTASAADRHQARKLQQFRNANNAVVVAPTPVYPQAYPDIYSGGWSAPAGR